MNKTIKVPILLLAIFLSCNQSKEYNFNSSEPIQDISRYDLDQRRVAMLNELRNDLLISYGTIDGWSRINMGPCGRFANTFRNEWNSIFKDSVNIVFMMNLDRTECNHIIVRLPDGNLFDAGLGVVSDTALLTIMPDNHIEDMPVFDYDLLDKRAYNLERSYPNCPNYSDELTESLLRKHFSKLPE